MEALAVRRTGRGAAAVVVHDVDGRSGPAQLAGALVESLWQTEALLMVHHLMRGGLPDVNDGLAGQMLGCNQIGVVHRSPPGRAP